MAPKKKMNTNLTTVWSREDRDLLVELRTTMRSVQEDIQDIKGNVSSRLLKLEGNAVSKIELVPIRSDIKFLQRVVWTGMGAVAVLEIAFRYVFK